LQKPEPDPKLLSRWTLPRLPGWTARVNDSLTKQELDAVRLSAQRGKPLGCPFLWQPEQIGFEFFCG